MVLSPTFLSHWLSDDQSCVCVSHVGQWLLVEVTQPPGWIISSRVTYSIPRVPWSLPRPQKRFSVPLAWQWHGQKALCPWRDPFLLSRLTKMQHFIFPPFSILPSSLPFSSKENGSFSYRKYHTEWDCSLKFSFYYLGEENSPREESPKGKWAVVVPPPQQRSEGMAWVAHDQQLYHILVSKWGQIIFASSDDSAHLKNHDVGAMGTTTALLWVLTRKYLLSDLHKPITARKKQEYKASPGCRSMIMEEDKHVGSFLELSRHTPPWAEVKNGAIKCLSIVTRVWGCWSRGDDIHFNNYASFPSTCAKLGKISTEYTPWSWCWK